MKKKVNSRIIIFFSLILCFFTLCYLFYYFTRPTMVDYTSISEKNLYFPLLKDVQNEEQSYDINANSISFYSAVVDEKGNPLKNIEVVISDVTDRQICTLITDQNGFAGISGLASNSNYYISLGENVETSYKRSYHLSTNNEMDSTYKIVFLITKNEITKEEYDTLKEKYEKQLFSYISTPNSLEYFHTYDSWNHMSGCYVLKQKDLVGTKIYINSRKHDYDSPDKTSVILERRFQVSVTDSEVLDYQITPMKENSSITIQEKNDEIVITNYDKKNLTTYLATLTITFKKEKVIYKVSKTIDLMANMSVNSIIDVTVTKDNKVLKEATIVIERLSLGTSVAYHEKQEQMVTDGTFQISASSGTYKITKIYQGQVLDTLLFTVRNNEFQSIVF